MVRRRVVAHGLVQGVFFRDGCRRRADEAGVSGWVRNRPDGALEAVFEGDERSVARMCGWCREGPEQARVDRVDVTEEPPSHTTGFEVR